MAALRHIESIVGVEQSIPAMLKSKNWKTRLEAVNILSQRNNKETVDLLIPLLQDANKQVRFAVVKLLGASGDMRAFYALLEQLRVEENGLTYLIGNALMQFGKQVEQPLISLLKDSNPQVRSTVVRVLGNLASAHIVGPLIETLADADEPTRRFAAFVLGNLGDKRAVEPLIKLLQDSSEDVRWVTATALGNLGDESAIKPLLNVLDDECRTVSYNAADALVKLLKPSEFTTTLMLSLLNYNSPDVRYWAAVALGSSSSQDAIPALTQLAENDIAINQYGEAVSEAATQVIAKIKGTLRS